MRNFFLHIAVLVYVLGAAICPCSAASVAATDESHHAHAAMPHASPAQSSSDCHGAQSDALCASMASPGGRSPDALGSEYQPSSDDDAVLQSDRTAPDAKPSHYGGAPPLRVVLRARRTPVSLGDRLTE